MTLIVLTVLASAWLGYFALWFRDRRASRPRRGDGVVDTSRYFDRSFDAMSRERVSFASPGDSARNLGDLLESPRTRQQALRRRRHVATVLIAAALASGRVAVDSETTSLNEMHEDVAGVSLSV